MKHFQREQAIQDVNVAKWESGNIHLQSKSTKERNERLLNLVLDYDNRETLVFLKGIVAWKNGPFSDQICHNLPTSIINRIF